VQAGHRRYWVYAMLFTLGVINFIDRINMSVAAKPIAADFHLSPVALGYLFSSFYWMYVICLVPGGVVADRLGGRKIAAAAITLWSVMQMLTGLVSSYATMLAVRIGLGIGEAPTNAAVSRTLRDWSPFSERGLGMSIFTSGSYAGPAVGATLAGALITAVGWRVGRKRHRGWIRPSDRRSSRNVKSRSIRRQASTQVFGACCVRVRCGA